jgi:molybdopterin molybdotransferase
MAGCDGQPRVSIEQAVELLRRYPRPGGLDTVELTAALGRFLAEDVVAGQPVPAHASSAMDGYAFRHADLVSGTPMPLAGRVPAGHPLDAALPPGHAVRIFTGGMMPEGADTVAMQEDCTTDEACVRLPAAIAPGAHCRDAGDDIAAGTTVLTSGTRLRPQDLGIAASADRATLPVHRLLRVGLLATGDELRPPGMPLPPGCVRDTNRHTIGAAARALGARVNDYGVAPDDLDTISDMLATAAAENDLVISTGGVSVGDEDHVKPAVEKIGHLDFWRLAVKPGAPIAVGEVAATPFVGLPGNPVSSLVSFWLIGRPLLLHLMGATELEVVRYPAIADFEHHHRPGRREFLRARTCPRPDGTLSVATFHSTGSGMLSSLSWSDGLVEILEDQGDVHRGDTVRFVPYTALLS